MLFPRLLASACLALPLFAAPTITKVEPPNWWPGHSINPVRLLIRGANLHGARLETTTPALRTGLVRVNPRGTYVFVDVHIDPAAPPGPHPLRLTTPAGAAEVPFRLNRPLSRPGRFQGFSSDDVIYLLMPDRFANGDPSNDNPPAAPGLHDRSRGRYYHGGDFAGIVRRLPYLDDLGVTAIWMNPVYDNVNHPNNIETYDHQPTTDYHGYGAVDYYAVDEHFGNLAQLRELVDEAHRHGIKVIQDQVANHTGPYHPWVGNPPTPTWYHGTKDNHLANTWQTWTLADPHSTAAMRRATLRGWFLDILPDLNQDDPETARYLIQNTLWWVGQTGFDGIRQDTLPYVSRRFWRSWTAAIKREYPRLKVVGELFDGDPSIVSFYQGGAARFDGIDSGVDTLFDFPLYYPLRRAFAQGRTLREVPNMLARDHLYPDPGALVTFLGLHDVARFMNEPGATAAGLKLAFTFLLTARGTPLIYYGDEIALRGGADPDNRRDFPGGWPGDPRNAFEPAGRSAEQEDVHAHVRRLARVRHNSLPLRRGRMVHLYASEQQFAFARVYQEDVVLVAINNDHTAATFTIDLSALPVSTTTKTITLPPRTATVEPLS